MIDLTSVIILSQLVPFLPLIFILFVILVLLVLFVIVPILKLLFKLLFGASSGASGIFKDYNKPNYDYTINTRQNRRKWN